jgi:Holliday junction resolvase RusA-like endonuclease
MSPIDLTLKIKTVSEANNRDHWRVKAKRAKSQRQMARIGLSMSLLFQLKYELPLAISFTRISKKPLDSDNLQSAMKAIRDGVADALEINDGSELITWNYRQEVGKEHAVNIRVAQL